MDTTIPIKRALLSVHDKTGLLELAQLLRQFNVEIISTGGTFKTLHEAGISVVPVSEITRFPEILGGRVKTLHPAIHGGILAKRTAEQLAELAEYHIGLIDLVVVNLYPFEKTTAQPDVTLETALENIDIGGPCMIRAAAKNFTAVTVVVDPSQYSELSQDLISNNGGVSLGLRQKFALEAFRRTAAYDQAIGSYLAGLSKEEKDRMPSFFSLDLVKSMDLRYGENPHQRAAFYVERAKPVHGIAAARQLHGKELSYNNLLDLSAAIGLVLEFQQPAVAIIKHTNPCGAALA
ncbi:MAG: bifunctional phosphoribosylaminoimidazolecarboxamide formyltransferase/IMP cyclohydrolase, partial [candidate division KSB1 bacterium]|nr:bifunctional phosphoribosylaminoimidazolecarboxamide formyltransferase/IMP cyclohydrolase [candidate division KSB1 bacterium]